MALFPDTSVAGVARLAAPVTLREAIVAQLRKAIITGELAPGTLLKDAELAAQLGLSTTPVREALVQLAGEGLVEIEPNRLKRVTPMDLDAMVELLEVQSQLWRLGYIWGAPRVGPAELQQLREVHAAHVAAIARGDTPAVIAAAPEFHRVIVEASGNRELMRVSLDRMALIRRFVTLCAPWLATAERLGHHQKMLDALEQGDAPAAIAAYEEISNVTVDAAKSLREQAK